MAQFLPVYNTDAKVHLGNEADGQILAQSAGASVQSQSVAAGSSPRLGARLKHTVHSYFTHVSRCSSVLGPVPHLDQPRVYSCSWVRPQHHPRTLISEWVAMNRKWMDGSETCGPSCSGSSLPFVPTPARLPEFPDASVRLGLTSKNRFSSPEARAASGTSPAGHRKRLRYRLPVPASDGWEKIL